MIIIRLKMRDEKEVEMFYTYCRTGFHPAVKAISTKTVCKLGAVKKRVARKHILRGQKGIAGFRAFK